ncbi:MAG: alanine--tRNA ligase [Pirellulales bacterium]
MKVDELREKYLEFFESKGHVRRPSDVLVPTWDPSVLFTPAGMNQFKDHFLGKVRLDFTRATSCQKCMRTGDIDNVGRTAYHHTFFEMLGNFSFGDYFKREAIAWAWEFLTDKKWLGLDPGRLSVSVYDEDDEAAEIWGRGIKLTLSKIQRMGEDDNFWPANAPSQGPDGVCGPCSEIFYHSEGGKSVEIWNLVFTQFNRVGEPPDNLRPLPSKNIDTGMGLERTAAVLQGVETNFHIDNLLPIVQAAAEVCGTRYEAGTEIGRRLRRITDHVRACTFAIHENVYPGPNKEKYVIRRLLRRAVLDGHQIGRREPFLHELVAAVVDAMRGPYPELRETADRVSKVIRQEEENFFGTIDAGLARLEKTFSELQSADRVTIDGREAAELYQTYGVPPELVESMAAEHNLAFDWEGFRQAMATHGEASGKLQFELFKTGPVEALKKALHATEFVGYETTKTDAEIKGIIARNQLCDQLDEIGHDQPVIVVLDKSPFYGESGGQVGDTGEIVGEGFRFRVTDTQREGDLILHFGHLAEGEITAGSRATARVDAERRQGVRRAHSATHLLHYALQSTLGSHAQQQGSKVDEDWLRFDFTNLAPVSAEELAQIEQSVQEKVELAAPVAWRTLPLAEARQVGAMMLFGEKYPDPVRMVEIGDFSRELCGGTHLDSTGEVGPFELVGEEGVSAGTRRIVALTGEKAREQRKRTESELAAAAKVLGVPPLAVPEAVGQLAQQVRALKKRLAGAGGGGEQKQPAAPTASSDESSSFAQMKAALQEAARVLNVGPTDVAARAEALRAEVEKLRQQVAQREAAGPLSADDLLEQSEPIGEVAVVIQETPGAGPGDMRQLIDQLRRKRSPVAVLLASREEDDKVVLVAGISRDLQERGVHAGNWVREVAKVVGGGGGGRPDLAQAGGKLPEKLPAALEAARKHLQEQLGK